MSPEAQVGEILVRVGLSLTAILIAAVALIVALRVKAATYPTKLANKVAEIDGGYTALELKLIALEDSLKSHAATHAARARREKEATPEAAPGAAELPAAVPVAAAAGAVDPNLFRRMPPAMKSSILAAGLAPAGRNGG